MTNLLFRFTEYGTLNQIYIAAADELLAKVEAKRRGDYRTMQWLGEVFVVPRLHPDELEKQAYERGFEDGNRGYSG